MSSFRMPSPGETIAVGTALPAVGTVVVALRFYSRHHNKAGYSVDDWMILVATLLFWGSAIPIVIGTMGQAYAYKTPPIPASEMLTIVHPVFVLNRKTEYVLLMLSFAATTFVKLSLLFFYKRIFCSGANSPVLKAVLWSVIALTAAWGAAFFFAMTFLCGTNFWAFWYNLYTLRTMCADINGVNYWVGITNFVLDAFIFFFPWPLIWRLELNTSRKVSLMAVFSIGALAMGASTTRLVFNIKATQASKKAYSSGGVNIPAITIGCYWTVFETGVSLIAASLPSCYNILIAPLMRQIHQLYQKTVYGSGYGESSAWRSRTRSNVRASQGNQRLGSEVDFKAGHHSPDQVELATVATSAHSSNGSEHNHGEAGITITQSIRQSEKFVA